MVRPFCGAKCLEKAGIKGTPTKTNQKNKTNIILKLILCLYKIVGPCISITYKSLARFFIGHSGLGGPERSVGGKRSWVKKNMSNF